MEYYKKDNPIQSIELIGILATDEEVSNETGQRAGKSVYINSNNQSLHYHIKIISRIQGLNTYNTSNDLFMGYLSCIKGYEDKDNMNEEDSTRVKNFKDFFENFIFIFNYERPSPGGKFCKISRATVIKKKDLLNRKELYVATPLFTPASVVENWETANRIKLNRSYNNYEEFLSYIKEKKKLGKVIGYNIKESIPFFVIWQDDEKTVAIGPLKINTSTPDGYNLEYDKISEFNLKDEILENIIGMQENPTLVHFQENTYDTIYKELITSSEESDLNPIKEAINAEIDRDIKMVNTAEKNDKTVLDLFQYYSQKANLYYDMEDLINFHTAIKTGSLVILTGMSGIGKSRIVDCYAHALGLDESSSVTIPVRPSWNDDSDLLGYLDLIHMVYRPSDTGFVKILIEAEKNRDKLYLVCLDEMNLARVEHYFSQFLSILERPEGQRKLRLYDEEFEQRLYNSAQYPDEIEIGNNIKFIGTVNIDESTYHFSDKVLDRANVINLKVLDYSKSWISVKYGYVPPIRWSKDDFNNIVVNRNQIEKDVKQRAFLWELHNMLSEYCVGLGVGPRVVTQIELFMANLPKTGIKEYDMELGRAFDLQVKQRVLTKIRGSEEQLAELLGVSEHTQGSENILDLFERYNMISSFELCRKNIEHKKKELKVYGYCL